MERVRTLMSRIDALSVRERALLMLAFVSLLYVAWEGLSFAPLTAREARVLEALENTRGAIAALDAEAEAILARHRLDPDAENRATLERLRAELETMKTELKASAERLVPPERMAEALETVLAKSRSVTFLALEGLGARPVLEDSAVEDDAPGAVERSGAPRTAYRHGLRLELEGGYLEVLALLRELEALPWAFLWDRIEFEVLDYPRTRWTITVHTLSLDRDWIGV